MEPTKPKSRNLDQFMNEVAPPRFISVSKRPLTTMLATIAEEEKDFNDDEVVKGRRTYSSSVCGKAAICCVRCAGADDGRGVRVGRRALEAWQTRRPRMEACGARA
ncbi:hypothetical protein Gotur_032526 [Gossypium turneri]